MKTVQKLKNNYNNNSSAYKRNKNTEIYILWYKIWKVIQIVLCKKFVCWLLPIKDLEFKIGIQDTFVFTQQIKFLHKTIYSYWGSVSQFNCLLCYLNKEVFE